MFRQHRCVLSVKRQIFADEERMQRMQGDLAIGSKRSIIPALFSALQRRMLWHIPIEAGLSWVVCSLVS